MAGFFALLAIAAIGELHISLIGKIEIGKLVSNENFNLKHRENS